MEKGQQWYLASRLPYDLAKILGYNDYRNFLNAVDKAKVACEQSSQAILDHFGDITEMI